MVNSENRERTYMEFQEMKKVESSSNSSGGNKDSFYKEKQIIRTYHHIIKKILPPFLDITTKANESMFEENENLTKQPVERNSRAINSKKTKFVIPDVVSNLHNTTDNNYEPHFNKSKPFLKTPQKKKRKHLKYGIFSKKKQKKPKETDLNTRGAKTFLVHHNKQRDIAKMHHPPHRVIEFKKRIKRADTFEVNPTADATAQINVVKATTESRIRKEIGKVIAFKGKEHLTKNTSKIVIERKNTTESNTETSPQSQMGTIKQLSVSKIPVELPTDDTGVTPIRETAEFYMNNYSESFSGTVPQFPLEKTKQLLVPQVPPEIKSKIMETATKETADSYIKNVNENNKEALTQHQSQIFSEFLDPQMPAEVKSEIVEKLIQEINQHSINSTNGSSHTKLLPYLGAIKMSLDPKMTSEIASETIEISTKGKTEYHMVGHLSKIITDAVGTVKADKTTVYSSGKVSAISPFSSALTGEINMDDIIQLIKNTMPVEEIEQETEIKRKNKIAVFTTVENNSSSSSINITCEESPLQEKRLGTSLLLWIMSMFCLLLIVVMGFLIYVTKMKDTIHEMQMSPNKARGVRFWKHYYPFHETKAEKAYDNCEKDIVSDYWTKALQKLSETTESVEKLSILSSC